MASGMIADTSSLPIFATNTSLCRSTTSANQLHRVYRHITLLLVQVLWPGSERVIKDTDLYVGAVLPILKRSFQLLDADEFTYQYMENNQHSYPVADADYALNILAAAIKTGTSVQCSDFASRFHTQAALYKLWRYFVSVMSSCNIFETSSAAHHAAGNLKVCPLLCKALGWTPSSTGWRACKDQRAAMHPPARLRVW